jgi:hypothetical protein
MDKMNIFNYYKNKFQLWNVLLEFVVLTENVFLIFSMFILFDISLSPNNDNQWNIFSYLTIQYGNLFL